MYFLDVEKKNMVSTEKKVKYNKFQQIFKLKSEKYINNDEKKSEKGV
jgi:hypothetical protein